MTIYEFERLGDTGKGQAILKSGVLLAERFCMDLRVALYQIEGFYVEVYFNSTYKVIQGLKSFIDSDSLDPYLEQIDISELLYTEL
ncbi:MAG TPA: hypothetical protein VNS32_02735 [Flavisolibacter sp.]|nr:hypothetical protein [Flavisolibacter sp.]